MMVKGYAKRMFPAVKSVKCIVKFSRILYYYMQRIVSKCLTRTDEPVSTDCLPVWQCII